MCIDSLLHIYIFFFFIMSNTRKGNLMKKKNMKHTFFLKCTRSLWTFLAKHQTSALRWNPHPKNLHLVWWYQRPPCHPTFCTAPKHVFFNKKSHCRGGTFAQKKQHIKKCHRNFPAFHARILILEDKCVFKSVLDRFQEMCLKILRNLACPTAPLILWAFFVFGFKAQNVERVDLEDFLKIVPWSQVATI